MSTEPPLVPKPPDKDPGAPGPKSHELRVIADTVVGVNIRLTDNLFQAAAALLGLAAGALMGFFAVEDRLIGAAAGAAGGLLAGVFLSGFVLMIFRALMHALGKHD